MLESARKLDSPLVDTPYEVWSLASRPAQDGQHHWRMRMRLGPHASGEGANYMVSVKTIPPAPRNFGDNRETSGIPQVEAAKTSGSAS